MNRAVARAQAGLRTGFRAGKTPPLLYACNDPHPRFSHQSEYCVEKMPQNSAEPAIQALAQKLHIGK